MRVRVSVRVRVRVRIRVRVRVGVGARLVDGVGRRVHHLEVGSVIDGLPRVLLDVWRGHPPVRRGDHLAWLGLGVWAGAWALG